MLQISADRHTKEDGPKEECPYYKITWRISYIKNTKIFVRRDTTPFVGITILSKHMNWILLTQVQEIRSGFGLEFTLMSGFGTMAMWSDSIWSYSLLPINEYG